MSLGKAALRAFARQGYHLERGLFPRKKASAAAQWLHAQDQAKLAKTWTEQEPGVPLAVYTVVHKGKDPVSELANDKRMLGMASELMGSEVYIWASKVNVKAAWCGTVEYYHQDLVYWKDRGYPKDEMLSCMVCLEPHGLANAGLHVLPGTHKYGFIEHEPFININGLGKFMIPPKRMDALYKKHGLKVIEAEPGDVLFFHTSLVHGSAHNISPFGRMILLSQLNTVGNEPVAVSENARRFNLARAEREVKEAERKYLWFKKKYEEQLASRELTFLAPIPDEERKPHKN